MKPRPFFPVIYSLSYTKPRPDSLSNARPGWRVRDTTSTQNTCFHRLSVYHMSPDSSDRQYKSEFSDRVYAREMVAQPRPAIYNFLSYTNPRPVVYQFIPCHIRSHGLSYTNHSLACTKPRPFIYEATAFHTRGHALSFKKLRSAIYEATACQYCRRRRLRIRGSEFIMFSRSSVRRRDGSAATA